MVISRRNLLLPIFPSEIHTKVRVGAPRRAIIAETLTFFPRFRPVV